VLFITWYQRQSRVRFFFLPWAFFFPPLRRRPGRPARLRSSRTRSSPLAPRLRLRLDGTRLRPRLPARRQLRPPRAPLPPPSPRAVTFAPAGARGVADLAHGVADFSRFAPVLYLWCVGAFSGGNGDVLLFRSFVRWCASSAMPGAFQWHQLSGLGSRMRLHMRGLRLWEFLTGELPCPAAPPAPPVLSGQLFLLQLLRTIRRS
jgi:hypothetical protein